MLANYFRTMRDPKAVAPFSKNGFWQMSRRQVVLVAEVRDGDAVDQITPENGVFVNRCVVFLGSLYDENTAELLCNSGWAPLHFRLKQNMICWACA